MKIGILTLFWGNNNWGGTLQGYALKKYIETRYPQNQVKIIRYCSSSNVVYRNRFEQMQQYGLLDVVKKLLERFIEKIASRKGQLNCRKTKFREFHEAYTENTRIYNDDDYVLLANDYDCLICGSDQIWNPNVAYPAFFLKGIKGCKKIAYAASIARDGLSAIEKKRMLPLIQEFDYISVRENTAKQILESELPEMKITQTLDPVLMLTKEEWFSFASENENDREPYALSFFFSESNRKREKIKEYCRSNKLKLIMLPHCAKYQRSDEEGPGEKIYDVGPKEFVQLIKNAACVFTDSFHGAVFSIIFEKPFLAFCRDKVSKVSKNSRMTDLLLSLGLKERLISGDVTFDGQMDVRIDYSEVNKKIEDLRRSSISYLDTALANEEKKESTTVEMLDKSSCCGCGGCKEVCPVQAVSMTKDCEGFLYPAVDHSLCVQCGKCVSNCSMRTVKKNKDSLTQTWIGYHKNENIRKNSSSGGVFYEISSEILNTGGTTYGAAFDERFSVRHERIVHKAELPRVMRSKYVQSTLDEIWKDVFADLREGRKVLFVGTPCQCAAIRGLAEDKKIDHNLFLMDFICHGVPSPGIWESYLGYVSDKARIVEVNFRDKERRGWHDFHMRIRLGDGSELNQSHELNRYMQTFLQNQNVRPSCYRCPYKGKVTEADLTLGDAWKIEKEFFNWADDKGTSLLIVHTDKGEKMLGQIRGRVELKESDYQRWCRYNPSVILPAHMPEDREVFYEKYRALNRTEFWNQAGSVGIKKRVRYAIKQGLKVLHVENLARKLK